MNLEGRNKYEAIRRWRLGAFDVPWMARMGRIVPRLRDLSEQRRGRRRRVEENALPGLTPSLRSLPLLL